MLEQQQPSKVQVWYYEFILIVVVAEEEINYVFMIAIIRDHYY